MFNNKYLIFNLASTFILEIIILLNPLGFFKHPSSLFCTLRTKEKKTYIDKLRKHTCGKSTLLLLGESQNYMITITVGPASHAFA